MVPMNATNVTTIMTLRNPRLELDKFYAFARANQHKFATIERFRPCGREIKDVAAISTIGYEVATFDQQALMRAFVQHMIEQKTQAA
jgi:hypothetical protein